MRVRGPPIALSFHARVAQRQEASRSGREQCRFESVPWYHVTHAAVDQRQESVVSKTTQCPFESDRRHGECPDERHFESTLSIACAGAAAGIGASTFDGR